MEFEEYEAQLADAGPSFAQEAVLEPDAQNADAEAEQSLISNIRQRLGL